jgi:cell division septation protein DedD
VRSLLAGALVGILVPQLLAAQGSARTGGDSLDEAERLLERHEYQGAGEAVGRFWSSAGDTVRGDRRARALLLRSVLSESLDDAELDLLRISVEHPQSPVADRALMRLAQARFAHGDSAGAKQFLERLVRDHPTSTLQRPAREMLGLPAVVASAPAPRAQQAAPPARQPAAPRAQTPARQAAAPPTPAGELTIEMGRFASVQEAEELRDAVRVAGFAAFLARPGRSGTTVVRFGSFRDRGAAEAAANRIRQAGFTAVITAVGGP